MSINVRYAGQANGNCDLAIERVSDGLFFDFASGAFSETPANIHLPLVQLASVPGRYAATAPHQQPAQFAPLQTYVFWVFNFTGLLNPARTVAWMEGVIFAVLPASHSRDMVITLSEPAPAP